MMVEHDGTGRRRVEAEIEVPGTPEEVWRAIATSEGLSSWFYRSRVEGGVGGAAECDFGPGMESIEQITAWKPPESYSTAAPPGEVEEPEDGPRDIATEWIVEARGGNLCVVRVVHSWFAETDDWDGQFEGHVYGWMASFLPALRLYLTHYQGQKCSAFQITHLSPYSGPQTMRTVKDSLGIGTAKGEFASTELAPDCAGRAQSLEVTDPEVRRLSERSPQVSAALHAMGGEDPDLLLNLRQPAPGIAYISTTPLEAQALVSLRVHLFGDESAEAATGAEREWNNWLTTQFPQQG